MTITSDKRIVTSNYLLFYSLMESANKALPDVRHLSFFMTVIPESHLIFKRGDIIRLRKPIAGPAQYIMELKERYSNLKTSFPVESREPRKKKRNYD